jgi:hypothetical protein
MDFWRSLAIIAELIKARRYDEAWEFIQRNKCDRTDGNMAVAPIKSAAAPNTWTGKGGTKRTT